jgi:hypothetical protein
MSLSNIANPFNLDAINTNGAPAYYCAAMLPYPRHLYRTIQILPGPVAQRLAGVAMAAKSQRVDTHAFH